LAVTSKYFWQVGGNFLLEASASANGLYQHRQTIEVLVSSQMKEIQECSAVST